MKQVSKIKAALGLSASMLSMCLLPFAQVITGLPAEAAVSVDYPPQLMNIASTDNSGVISESGTADGSALTVKALGGDLSCSWRFDRVGADSNGTFFKLCSAQSGRLLTPQGYSVTEGTPVIIYGSESAKSQHWYVIPEKKDHLGNGLYYKIVNYENTALALTRGVSGLTLGTYTGADDQLWLLNCDGLQGFAGYCQNDQTGNIKAGDIGGLFGEVVEASNFAELSKYATADQPYTIVVTGDLKITDLQKDSQNHYYCPAGRIYVHSNKTIIGSYGSHTLYNVQFCTSANKGKGDNLIIKNLELQHDHVSNGNDSIVVYFGSGQNLWVDHCTFTGHQNYNMLGEQTCPDYDKFLACCYDADFCTVSDNSFGLHEYGLILGYPDDTADVKNKYDQFPRMTIAGNKFDKTLTRAPGLMRWGYFHSLNNYVNSFSMAYTVHSGCDIYAENCFYENGGNVICDWNQVTYTGYYAESGSKFNKCSRTKQGEGTNSNPALSKPSGFRPAGNYSYTALDADSAKNYCNTYSGSQSSSGNMMYLRYSTKGIPSAGYNEAPDAPPEPLTGKLVKEFTPIDTQHPGWEIAYNAAVGDKIFGDRDFTFTELPSPLLGAERIITPCDSKYAAGDLGSFTAAQDVTVYIGLDTRITAEPAWLADFTKMRMQAFTSNEVTLGIYQKDVKAGETVTLGNNGGSDYCVCYTVFIQEAVPTVVRGDINQDGACTIADAVLLQRWLTCEPDALLPDWQLADLNSDGILTAVDLTLLKAILIG